MKLVLLSVVVCAYVTLGSCKSTATSTTVTTPPTTMSTSTVTPATMVSSSSSVSTSTVTPATLVTSTTLIPIIISTTPSNMSTTVTPATIKTSVTTMTTTPATLKTSPTTMMSTPATLKTSPEPPVTPAPKTGFSGASFGGGIALGLGLCLIVLLGYILYQKKSNKGYNTM